MTTSEKKNKRNGIVGTILLHALVIVAFLFMGLTYQIPPPPEEGISINFGYINEGSTETEPEDQADITEPVQDEIIEEQSAAEEEIITQDIEEAPVTEKTEQKKTDPKPEKEEVIEQKEPKVITKALYPGKKNTQKNQGDKQESGNQGEFDGDPNAQSYNGGGIGADGIAYQLGGRSPEFKAKPVYKIQEEGKVVVLITVDRLGNVVNAIPGAKGSTTLNKYLLARAKEAALKTKFNPKQSAPENQQGKIIYHFSLN